MGHPLSTDGGTTSGVWCRKITLPFPQTRITYIEGWCGKKISKDIWWYYGISLSYIAIYQLFAVSFSLIKRRCEICRFSFCSK